MNIILDMGDVILQQLRVPYAGRWVSDPEEQRLIVRELFSSVEWLSCDLGTLPHRDVPGPVAERLPEHLRKAVREISDSYPASMALMPGAKDFIETLLREGYPLYLLSNVGDYYEEHIRPKIPHIDEFRGEFLSFREHLLKPEKAIFTAFLERFSLDPRDCFFVDDVPANMLGAYRAGFRGMVFRNDYGAVLDEIRRLNES